MEIVAENLVKEIVDASIEVKSISDCIDDCEYGAAKKSLKRHKKCKLKKLVKSWFYKLQDNIIDGVGN